MSNYTFDYSCTDGIDSDDYPAKKFTSVSVDFAGDGTWPSVLREFCNFLSTIYGYSIKDRIYVDCLANDGYFSHPEDYKPEEREMKTVPEDGWDEDDEWEAFKQWQASRKGDDE